MYKPGYEELEQKILDLENTIQEHKKNNVELIKENEDLKQIKKYYGILMNNTDDYFLISDKDGIPQAFNASYREKIKEIFNIEMKPGLQLHKFPNEQTEKYWNSLCERVLKGEKFVSEYSHKLNGKQPQHFETLFCPVKEGEKVTGFTEITRDITKHREMEKILKESEHRYHTLFEKMLDACALHEVICDENGNPVSFRYLDVNPAFEKATGFKGRDIIGKDAFEYLPDIDPFLIETYGKVALTGEPVFFDYHIAGVNRYYMISAFQPQEGQFVCILHEITEQKKMEKGLIKARTELEKRVRERTRDLKASNKALYEKTVDLEEVNTALKVLLERRDKDKEEVGERTLYNVKELLIPYINKMKLTSLTQKQKNYIELLETGLNDIISPFVQSLTSRYMHITPGEMHVANLVREGKTSKEIAEILNSTERAVIAHRLNLRKKFGLKRKSNLRTYLQSID